MRNSLTSITGATVGYLLTMWLLANDYVGAVLAGVALLTLAAGQLLHRED